MELGDIFSDRNLGTGLLERTSRASDASVYSILPEAVVWPEGIDEVRRLLEWCRSQKKPVTFRAGGTSLSGQTVGPGIICDLSRSWREAVVSGDGTRVTVQPGIVGGHVNSLLQPFQRKIGPDPASISAAMMGGILANNSSGMCCGVDHNAYHTMESMKILLASGLWIDSGLPDARERFFAEAPHVAQGLVSLRERILAHPPLAERIRRKYRYKNTTGYGLNSFLDYSCPLDILTHLMIGSEGTLGFIAEATLRTIPARPFALTGLLFFSSPEEACAAIVPLREAGAEAVELMDRTALRSVEELEGSPALLRSLPHAATGLLVEFQSSTKEELEHLEQMSSRLCTTLRPCAVLPFTRVGSEQEKLWKLRKGMFPAVGASRRAGTSVIIEDILFPLETLAQGVNDLRALFARHGYNDAILFGHAKDGNLHFVICQDFANGAEVRRYDRFLQEMVDLVAVRHEGALKAEHGTGRNMAPFIAAEWGDEGVAIMKKVKALLDPDNLLNPGVIVNSSPDAHVRHLKGIPEVDPLVDKCIECGYCVPTCPSERYTLSPRDRIVVSREMRRREQRSEDFVAKSGLAELRAGFSFQGVETCATDGLCALACPVGINTGLYVKALRARAHGRLADLVAHWIQRHFAKIEKAVGSGLALGNVLLRRVPELLLSTMTGWVRRCLRIPVPFWTHSMPRVASRVVSAHPTGTAQCGAVLFPTCVNRVMGPSFEANRASPTPAHRNDVLVEICRRAGLALRVPEKAEGQCCGMPFFSKGFTHQGLEALSRLVRALWEWSDHGRIPVVVDNSPCTHSLLDHAAELDSDTKQLFDSMRVVDIVEFTHDWLLPRLELKKIGRTVQVYPVCSVSKMGLTAKLRAIAERCATEVIMPARPACCAQAGDRGFHFPELTRSACEKISWSAFPKKETQHDCACSEGRAPGYFSTSRTCEINLSRNFGETYTSILDLVLECTAGNGRKGAPDALETRRCS